MMEPIPSIPTSNSCSVLKLAHCCCNQPLPIKVLCKSSVHLPHANACKLVSIDLQTFLSNAHAKAERITFPVIMCVLMVILFTENNPAFERTNTAMAGLHVVQRLPITNDPSTIQDLHLSKRMAQHVEHAWSWAHYDAWNPRDVGTRPESMWSDSPSMSCQADKVLVQRKDKGQEGFSICSCACCGQADAALKDITYLS